MLTLSGYRVGAEETLTNSNFCAVSAIVDKILEMCMGSDHQIRPLMYLRPDLDHR